VKTNKVILVSGVLLVLLVGLLAACCVDAPEGQPTTQPTEVPQEQPTTKPTTEPTTEPLEPTEESSNPTEAVSPVDSPLDSPLETPVAADGATLLQERCGTCHDLERVTGANKDRPGWEESVDRMIEKGAVLSEEERVVLIDYLVEMYGP
jgi:glucose/arabinose dehydrogenase